MTPNARIRQALADGCPDLPARFLTAYQAGGTPTSLHLKVIANAAGVTPIWLLTGWTPRGGQQ